MFLDMKKDSTAEIESLLPHLSAYPQDLAPYKAAALQVAGLHRACPSVTLYKECCILLSNSILYCFTGFVNRISVIAHKMFIRCVSLLKSEKGAYKQ